MQSLLLGATQLTIALVGDSLYGLAATGARRLFTQRQGVVPSLRHLHCLPCDRSGMTAALAMRGGGSDVAVVLRDSKVGKA
jgi:hypothetical protein